MEIEPGQDIPKTSHKITDNLGFGWFQALHLPLNMVIRKGIIRFKPEASGTLYTLMTIKGEFTEPVVCMRTLKAGRIILSDLHVDHDFIFGMNDCLFQHYDLGNTEIKVDASQNFEMITLLIGESLLIELCGQEYERSYFTALRIESIPGASVHKIPHHINALLYSSILDHLTGNIAKLHAQAKVLGYLYALGEYFGATTMTFHQDPR